MKKLLLILPMVILLLSWCTVKLANVSYNEIPYDSYPVQQWSISLGDNFVWNIEALEQTMVAPKVGWRINQIMVEEWDIVKKWDILASLDWEEIGANYNSASNVLNSTQLLYNNTASMFDSQITAMENKINQSKSAIELTEKALKWVETWLIDVKKISIQQLETAKKWVEQTSLAVETSKIELEHTKKVLNQKEKDIYSNSKNALAQSKILIINISDFIDQTLGISDINKYKNDNWEDYLGAKDTEKLNIAKQQWLEFNNGYKELSTKLEIAENNINDIISNNDKKKEIYNILKETENLLILARKLTANMYSIIDNSIVSSKLSQSQLNTMKSTTITYQNNIEKMLISVKGEFIMGVKWSLQAIDNLNKESNMKLDLLNSKYDMAVKQLETAEQTYKQYVAISQWKVNEVNTKKSISEQQYKISQEQYDEALSQLEALKKQKQSQLSKIQAQLNQIKWNKNLASIQIKNTNITAPYDGVIVEKIGNLGQVVGPWTPVFAIADNTNLKVKVFVAEQIVKNISLGDSVSIKINNTDDILTGSIYYISPISDMMSKRVPIEIKINNKDLKLRLGIYTTVYLTGKEIKWYKIPYRFIKYKYGESYISIKKNDKIEKTNIEIIWCDNEECIIKWNIDNNDELVNN